MCLSQCLRHEQEVFIPCSGLLGLYHHGEKYYEEGIEDVSEGDTGAQQGAKRVPRMQPGSG